MKEYLSRINFNENGANDPSTLINLHTCHVHNVPFENLDIQNKKPIRLNPEHLYLKIVSNYRGGFCYELNYLFYLLLKKLQFNVDIISARIFDKDTLGPEFDHMALMVKFKNQHWLADVGFGDLFVRPIKMVNNLCQWDGRNYFKIQPWQNGSFLLSMSNNKVDFTKKYVFTINPRDIGEFTEQCKIKQYSPNSYFVKNKVVTLPTQKGRKTLFNKKFIVKTYQQRLEVTIEDKKHETSILTKEFNMST